MSPVAEITFDLSYTEGKMSARLYPPKPAPDSEDWACTFEIDAPIAVSRTIYGVSSIQALVLALKLMAAHLYGSEAYKKKEFGIYGEFGGGI